VNLHELIASTKGDRSYADLAVLAKQDPGAKRWQQLATQPINNFPDPPTIWGMSRALGIPPLTVIHAAAESLGFEVRQDQSRLATLLPPAADQLGDTQIAAVRQMVLALLHNDGKLPKAARRGVDDREPAGDEPA
jgi:hypothetical protein